MAEFTIVSQIKTRLCKSVSDCVACPLYGRCNSPDHDPDYVEQEKILLEWAANNPEMRYPTWQEWVDTFAANGGNRSICPGAFVTAECYGRTCSECLSLCIPEETAKLLKIEKNIPVDDLHSLESADKTKHKAEMMTTFVNKLGSLLVKYDMENVTPLACIKSMREIYNDMQSTLLTID